MDSQELLATAPGSRDGHDTERSTVVIGINLVGEVIVWSPAAARLLGWSAAEVLGRPAVELIDWGVDARDAAKFLFVGGSGVWIREHVVTAKSGKRIRLRTTASIVAGPDGADEVLASSVEVLESTVSTVMSTGAQPFRALVERGSDLMLLCAEDVTISYAGPSLSQLFGYLPRELVGGSLSDFVHPEDVPALRHDWESLLAHPDRETSLDVRISNRTSRWRWVELRISNLIADASVAAMVLNIRDITEQREAADALAAKEELLRSIVDAGFDGVWVVDHSGATVFANARMAELLGVSEAALAKAVVSDFFDAAACELLRTPVPGRPTGIRVEADIPFVRRDGERRWLSISAVPYRDGNGHPLGTVSLCSDVTDHAQLEENVPGLHRLSRRELEVVRRLLDGDRVPAIADQLFISQSTIRNHLSSVFRKLRVRSQQELIELLRGHRLTDPGERRS
ncbi:PAS domain S-box protein [Jatrophihabitans lederbergiae]|uniref:PAS domain S-box protein n=1 Tax=Jatrophihabitans lederbergiae TaxID=3075547 RepID=A0ABU2J522_9ACTN|nr:PAS domain S-box protein [Jatrophihabitans sp. DSM 44399]MDT0260082.1 PAS domain S-box protein [Jatrophihabitans sp. DSM 44399]